MSRENIMKLYRFMCKNVANPIENPVFKNIMKTEIKNFKEGENITKILKENLIIDNFLMMNSHVYNERQLLESYGIGTVKDEMQKIQNVAKHCGLKVIDYR